MVTLNDITQEDIRNAKEFYDYYVQVDSAKAAFYKSLMDLEKKENGEVKSKSSLKTIKDVSLKHVAIPVEKVPLRLRKPKNGFSKTVGEIVKEILIEKDQVLTARELLAAVNERGRNLGELKDFSSQLISISKKKNQFLKKKINGVNVWGLSEWWTGIDFKKAYLEKSENKNRLL